MTLCCATLQWISFLSQMIQSYLVTQDDATLRDANKDVIKRLVDMFSRDCHGHNAKELMLIQVELR